MEPEPATPRYEQPPSSAPAPAVSDASSDGPAPGPESVGRLSEPPRTVPAVFRLGLVSFELWELFTVVIVMVSPMALWILVPPSFPPLALLVAGLGLARRWRRQQRQVRLLRWGQVAQVTASTSQWSSVSYSSVPMRQARGWLTTTRAYTGQGSVSTVDYVVDGRPGTLRLRGLPYAGGVVLADPREPPVAAVVSQLPFAVRPDAEGGLVGGPTAWQVIGMAATVCVYGGLVAVALLVAALVYA